MSQNFNIYIKKVLKQVDPGKHISQQCSFQLNALLNYLGDKISQLAITLAQTEKKKTVTARDIQISETMILGRELAKYANKEGIKAVTNYKSSTKKKGNRPVDRAGIVFPPVRARHLIEKNLPKHFHIGDAAPVYLAAVLEYLTAEFIQQTGNCTRDNNMNTLTLSCLYKATYNDEELNQLLSKIKFRFATTKVLPNIHRVLQKKPKPKRKSKKRSKSRSRR
jgi:histone H2A